MFRPLTILASVAALGVLFVAAPAGAAPPVEPNPVPISTGDDHSCAIDTSGLAYCWGIDNFGQLGNGPEVTGNQGVPTLIDMSGLGGGTRFVALSSSDLLTCGVTDAGAVACWGDDRSGQLGNGPDLIGTQWSPTSLDTSALAKGTRFVQVAAAEHSACALSVAGDIYCWGSDGPGTVGNGPDTEAVQDSPVPIDVSALPDGTKFASLSAGSIHLCAVTVDGDAYCWGNDAYEKLGNGPQWEVQTSPSKVDASMLPAGARWASVRAGDNHTCGLTTDGDAFCWGRNNRGQLGYGPSPFRFSDIPRPVTPATVPAGTTWRAIATGDEVTCGISSTGDLWCWGTGFGLGGGIAEEPVAIDVSALPADTAWTQISAATSGSHVCGRVESGESYCFGSDAFGQLGDGPGPMFTKVPLPIAFPWIVGPFGQPLAAGWTTAEAGSTVPVKFEVFDGAIELASLEAIAALSARPVDCVTAAPTGGETIDLLDDVRRAGGRFLLNWQTPDEPGTCLALSLVAADGSTAASLVALA